MRPVVVQMGVTLDGFLHGAKGYEDWGLPPEEDDVVAWKVASLRAAGTHIMGRANVRSHGIGVASYHWRLRRRDERDSQGGLLEDAHPCGLAGEPTTSRPAHFRAEP